MIIAGSRERREKPGTSCAHWDMIIMYSLCSFLKKVSVPAVVLLVDCFR